MYQKYKKAGVLANLSFIALISMTTLAHSKTIDSETNCLAKLIYHEARGESDLGKKSVAKVVLNRKQHPDYPKSICKVVNQIAYVGKKKVCQFSWICNQTNIDIKSESWDESVNLSHAILNNKTSLPNFSQTVLFFKTSKGKSFGRNYRFVSRIGGHNFYSLS